MASLEWSVDELARFLDAHPNAVVDLAARMSNLQVQSNADLEKVRAFFVKYQDRILYGTDLTDSPPDPAARAQNPPATDDFPREADAVWRADSALSGNIVEPAGRGDQRRGRGGWVSPKT